MPFADLRALHNRLQFRRHSNPAAGKVRDHIACENARFFAWRIGNGLGNNDTAVPRKTELPAEVGVHLPDRNAEPGPLDFAVIPQF